MTYQEHSIGSDNSPPHKFLVDRHWWILRYLCTDEHGNVRQLIGQWSEEHPETKTFDLSRVRDAREIALDVRALEANLRGASGDDDQLYLSAFAAGHKPGCPMAWPEFRSRISEIREKVNEILGIREEAKMKHSDVERIACKCGDLSADSAAVTGV